ncbi:MAG TPA: Rv3235 family protein [Candidatus Lumbricidophila sp.]|nr:Rv3235 family protein [Candidatus Lumbricidophila sp.]
MTLHHLSPSTRATADADALVHETHGATALTPKFRLMVDEFGPQPTGRNELPEVEPVIRSITHCVIEAFAGARDLEQLARWVTDDVYRALQVRVVLAARARRARGQATQRPAFTIGNVILSEPADGVVEAVAMVHQRVRSRAVAIRLEGYDLRWRATAISVL